MGFALAEAAAALGADVTVVAANVALPRRAGVRYVDVATAAELQAACEAAFAGADVLLMAAAVADFRPAAPARRQAQEGRPAELALALEPHRRRPVGAGRRRRPGQTVVGFAAEHGRGRGRARAREARAQGAGRRRGQRHRPRRHRLRGRAQRGGDRDRRRRGSPRPARRRRPTSRARCSTRRCPARGRGRRPRDPRTDHCGAHGGSDRLGEDEVEAAVALVAAPGEHRRAVKVREELLDHVISCALPPRATCSSRTYPGVGKTTLARALARSLDLQFARVQCTADLLPADVVGTNVFNQREDRFEFRPGPIFANVVLVDEINRASPKTQSGLLECMQERRVTVDVHSHELARPFIVLATQNPVEYEGTYPLPEAQVDRFMAPLARLPGRRPGEVAMLAAHEAGDRVIELEPVATAPRCSPSRTPPTACTPPRRCATTSSRCCAHARRTRASSSAPAARRPAAAARRQGARADPGPRPRAARRRAGARRRRARPPPRARARGAGVERRRSSPTRWRRRRRCRWRMAMRVGPAMRRAGRRPPAAAAPARSTPSRCTSRRRRSSLLALGAAGWIVAGAWGARRARTLGVRRVLEEEPLAVDIRVPPARCRCRPAGSTSRCCPSRCRSRRPAHHARAHRGPLRRRGARAGAARARRCATRSGSLSGRHRRRRGRGPRAPAHVPGQRDRRAGRGGAAPRAARRADRRGRDRDRRPAPAPRGHAGVAHLLAGAGPRAS